jgi:hypothetical protein
MKKKYDIKTKLKVCWYWLFKHGEGIMVNCGMCKSTQITLLENKQVDNEYISKYKCRRCGAIATNREVWAKN